MVRLILIGLLGVFIGFCLGIFFVSLCIASKSDKNYDYFE